MRSDYALMIDKHDVEALSFSKQASALSHQTLAVNPTMYDAYLASGVENYMLSLKWAPLRWLLEPGPAPEPTAKRAFASWESPPPRVLPGAVRRMMLAVAAVRDGHAQQARDILTALSESSPETASIPASGTASVRLLGSQERTPRYSCPQKISSENVC